MGADALVVWHSVYRGGRRWSKRRRVLATDSTEWRSPDSAIRLALCFSWGEITANPMEINLFSPARRVFAKFSKKTTLKQDREIETIAFFT